MRSINDYRITAM